MDTEQELGTAPHDEGGRRICTRDVRELLAPYGLDREIRRSGSGTTTTNVTFSRPEHAQRAAALVAQAWGSTGVTVEPHRHFGEARLRVPRDIESGRGGGPG